MTLKFRIYDKHYGMSEPFSLFWDEIEFTNPKDGGTPVIIYPKELAASEINSNSKKMQSTGLKDINGKEIFEGDIWKGEQGKWIAKIVWNEDCARFEYEIIRQKDKNTSYDIRMGRPERYEVIGNIYENPELLKEAA